MLFLCLIRIFHSFLLLFSHMVLSFLWVVNFLEFEILGLIRCIILFHDIPLLHGHQEIPLFSFHFKQVNHLFFFVFLYFLLNFVFRWAHLSGTGRWLLFLLRFLDDSCNLLLYIKGFMSADLTKKPMNILFTLWSSPRFYIVNLDYHITYVFLFWLAIKVQLLKCFFLGWVNSCYAWKKNLMNHFIIFFFFFLFFIIVFSIFCRLYFLIIFFSTICFIFHTTTFFFGFSCTILSLLFISLILVFRFISHFHIFIW